MIFDFSILAFWHFTSSAGSSVFFFQFPAPFTDFDLTGKFHFKKKTVASRHKRGDTIPKKPVFCRFLAIFFFSKTGNLRQNIPFSENCLAKKIITD
jgi:hypothetical protein